MNDYDFEPVELKTDYAVINGEVVETIDLSFCCDAPITETGFCRECGENQ